ncbi:cupin domain-containing protein [Terrimonas sp. NA20]|uniref:Cupin domain-containing protein n=1 Tax=Terrimonas ginsenosidimutans TaxID=2908004 RepID=A0ABS9KRA3_9BACT|nr:cupin domain-containing protein [Terrimonas ginsenosidimutans]MCG2614844.1 cupin domain-containing protein [Terrimonas ginsenosidimutans]
MKRRIFIKTSAQSFAALLLLEKIFVMPAVAPETYYFKDDGTIPNSRYPLLIYQQVFSQRGDKGGDWLEERFAANGWTNTWRWGVYPFHHYHSNTHEVLGCFSGEALLHMGGEKGEKLTVKAGDIIVIPAGVGHKCISHSDDFTVLGAYPGGLDPDLMKGGKHERPDADKNIAATLKPSADPFSGKQEGLIKLWKKE